LFFVGWVKRALPRKPIIEQGEAPDTLSILARDPLPLRLCAFAPLRSFLLTAGISARDPLPSRLCTFAPLRSFLLTAGISARDPLPSRLCTFAPLRSFLLVAGISARDPLPSRLCTFAPLRSFLPKGLTRGLPPHPPRPLLPQPKPWGRGGAKRFGGCAISPPAKAHAAHKASGAYHS
jgi:hypothetical protein